MQFIITQPNEQVLMQFKIMQGAASNDSKVTPWFHDLKLHDQTKVGLLSANIAIKVLIFLNVALARNMAPSQED